MYTQKYLAILCAGVSIALSAAQPQVIETTVTPPAITDHSTQGVPEAQHITTQASHPVGHQEHGTPSQTPPLKQIISQKIHLFIDHLYRTCGGTRDSLVSLITDTNCSRTFQFVLVFLLGLLMSLTPCIYPMIPITVGVLQTSGSHSLWRSFALATAYTTGISTTFALLGLLAAIGGMQFGVMMSNPWVLTALIIFLTYLAGAMLGYYEMYTPRFFQSSGNMRRKGSLVSAFLFGALSGTVASPCVSPGLALLLTLVASMQHKMMGFALLFVFGIGSSIPLLIVGTWSSSLHLLPRAGLWMIEVKKIFGLLLLGTVVYYMHLLLPLSWVYVIVSIGLIILGSSYILSGTLTPMGFTKTRMYRHVMGTALLVAGIFTMLERYKITCTCAAESEASTDTFWSTDITAAYTTARAENKLLFLDFTAQWCSLCRSTEKKILSESVVRETLSKHCVCVKVDCTDPYDHLCTEPKKKFLVIGFPTYLLVDPQDDAVIARWGSEILEMGAEGFAHDITLKGSHPKSTLPQEPKAEASTIQ